VTKADLALAERLRAYHSQRQEGTREEILERNARAARKLEQLEKAAADNRAAPATQDRSAERIAHRAAVAEWHARRIVETRDAYAGARGTLERWSSMAASMPDHHVVTGLAASSIVNNLLGSIERKGAELQAQGEQYVDDQIHELGDEVQSALNELVASHERYDEELTRYIIDHIEAAKQELRAEMRAMMKKAKVTHE
jgi:hypothetical protein